MLKTEGKESINESVDGDDDDDDVTKCISLSNFLGCYTKETDPWGTTGRGHRC